VEIMSALTIDPKKYARLANRIGIKAIEDQAKKFAFVFKVTVDLFI
jgi:hypothetical protein